MNNGPLNYFKDLRLPCGYNVNPPLIQIYGMCGMKNDICYVINVDNPTLVPPYDF